MPRHKPNKLIAIRVAPVDLLSLQAWAQARGTTVSDIVRDAISAHMLANAYSIEQAVQQAKVVPVDSMAQLFYAAK